MYRAIVIAVFLTTLAVIVGDALFLRLLFQRARGTSSKGQVPPLLSGRIRLCVNIIGFVCFAAAAGTGFFSLLTKENGLTGNWLIAHISAAPAFALASVVVVLFWAHRNRPALPGGDVDHSGGYPLAVRKLFFWIALAMTCLLYTSPSPRD